MLRTTQIEMSFDSYEALIEPVSSEPETAGVVENDAEDVVHSISHYETI